MVIYEKSSELGTLLGGAIQILLTLWALYIRVVGCNNSQNGWVNLHVSILGARGMLRFHSYGLLQSGGASNLLKAASHSY